MCTKRSPLVLPVRFLIQQQFTGTTVLPNGNIVLPNGTIITPTGQVVGQAGSIPSVGPTAFVNPYDQYTGTARVQKIFNGGIITLGTSLQQVDYEHAQQSSPDYINKISLKMLHSGSDQSFTRIRTDHLTSARQVKVATPRPTALSVA